MTEPTTVLAHYRAKDGHADELLRIVAGHWPVLRELGLVTDRPAEVFLLAEKETGAALVVEVFEWADAEASARAHTHPRISAVWEAMGPLCEGRDGRPSMEFPTGRRVQLP
jgi:hypothetical protein